MAQATAVPESRSTIDDGAEGGAADPRLITRAGAWSSLILGRYALVLAMLLLILIFGVLRPDSFLTFTNASSILGGSAALAIIALGAMCPLVVGQFDLSVGFVATAASVLATGLMSKSGLGLGLVIPIVLAGSAFVGLVQGYFVAVWKLNSLVVTLAGGSILSGLVLWYSDGAVIFDGLPASFLSIGQSKLIGIPLPFVYAVIVAVTLWYVLSFRALGRSLYAIGASEISARLLGLVVERRVILAFVASSVLAGVGGFVQASRLGAGHPTALQSVLLPAFAAAFLGATSIRPGFYNVWGTFLAVYLVAVGTTGLYMLGASSYIEPIFNGLVLLIAIAAAAASARRVTASRSAAPPAERSS